MKQRILLRILFLAAGLAFLATAASAEVDCKDAQSIKGLVKNPAAMTQDEYEAVLDTLSCCDIDQTKLAFAGKCATNEALGLLKKEKAKIPSINPLVPKLIKNSAPQVRARAYEELSGLFGSSSQDVALAKEAIASETDPYALKMLIWKGVHNLGNRVPEVGTFLLKMAQHEHPQVRWAAAVALGNTWSDKVPGATDAIITLIGDPDEKVRKMACKEAGKLGDEKIIAPITDVLNDDAKANMHSECMQGLTTLWLDFPFHKRYSEAAYKAAMDYYKKTPRTDKIPAWSSIKLAGEYAKPVGNKDAFADWKNQASYYKPDELIAIMTDIVKDPQANWMGRNAALTVIGKAGGKEALDKLAPEVEALNDPKAKFIKDGYQKALKEVEKGK
ncbi:MAG: HEAT repeat domain-containing protein [Deltaproteobacteria bacterium]|nr:HEAT repeat domain-containing protein [Deltaproteobacteria bacterium]